MLDQELVGLLRECNELSLRATEAFEAGEISAENVCRIAYRVAAIRSLLLDAAGPPDARRPLPAPRAPGEAQGQPGPVGPSLKLVA
jgi:hypothetical protein